MVWKPHVTVAAIACQDGRFLMVEERVNGRLVINQPAGHLEERESMEEAVVRETFEETGWKVAPKYLVGTYLWRSPGGKTFLRFSYAVELISHDADQPLDDGIVRSLWCSPQELACDSQRLRSPMVQLGIEEYLQGKRYALDSVHSLSG